METLKSLRDELRSFKARNENIVRAQEENKSKCSNIVDLVIATKTEAA